MPTREELLYAVSHLHAAAMKAWMELDQQAKGRMRLTEQFKEPGDKEHARAFGAWSRARAEIREHRQLAYEALGRADREDAPDMVRAALDADGQTYDAQSQQEIWDDVRRRALAHELASLAEYGFSGTDEFHDPDDFDPEADRLGR